MNNNKAKEEGSILSLIKYRSIRYKFLILCFLGFCVNGSYNGISISIKKLPGDLFQNGMLFYVFEVIVGFFSGCMINTKFFGRKGKVVPLNAQGQQVKMVISQPTTFEQSEEICSLLKEKKSVIVNLEYVNKDVARRIVDFISGGVYALDGHIQKISNSIFLIAPMNYEITNEMAREEIKSKLSVSWLKNNSIN